MTLVKNCIILPWTQVTSSDIVTVIILQLQSLVTTGQHNDTMTDNDITNEVDLMQFSAVISHIISMLHYTLLYGCLSATAKRRIRLLRSNKCCWFQYS